MKRTIFRMLCALALVQAPSAWSCTNTEWNSSVTEVIAIGQCTPASCTFSFTESITGATMSGTFTRPSTGFLVMTVNTKSLGTSTGWAFTGSTIYAVEIPGGTFVVQPLIAEDLYNPVIFISNQCPTGSFRANWIFGHWDPGGASDVSSSSQPAAGYLDSSGTSSVLLTVRDMYELTAFGSLGSLTLTPSAVTCSAGKATINAGTGDRQGTVYYGGASSVILYKTAACHSVFGVPQVNINSMAMLFGSYAGFAYDTKQASGFDTTGASVHQVAVTINAAGCTSASKCVGNGLTTGQVADSSYMGGGLTLQVNAINSPRTGMFTGYLFDGSANRGNVLCTINRNWRTTANTPPFYNNIFCVAQNPSANSEPLNIFLVSAAGTPGMDPTFYNSNGFTVLAFGTTDVPNAVTVAPDGKIYVAGYATISGKAKSVIARLGQDGNLDTTWASPNGYVATNVASSQGDESYKVMVQSDGKIASAVYSQVSASVFKPAVMRYNNDGTLDTTYGTSGITSATFSGYSDAELLGAAMLPNNKVVWSGTCKQTALNGFGVCVGRFNVDGSLDTSFGGTSSGFTFAHPAATAGCGAAVCTIQAWHMKLLPSGKILVAGGAATSTTTASIGVMQFNADGTLDTTFNSGGTYPGASWVVGGAWNDVGYAVDVQSTGKIIVGGYRARTSANSTYQWEVVRFNSDGTVDTNFGTSGVYAFNVMAGTNEQINDVYVQPDDKIVLTGSALNASGKYNMVTVRLTSAGVLDSTFGTGGIVTYINGTLNTVGGTIAADGQGRLIGAGYTGATDWGIFRLWP